MMLHICTHTCNPHVIHKLYIISTLKPNTLHHRQSSASLVALVSLANPSGKFHCVICVAFFRLAACLALTVPPPPQTPPTWPFHWVCTRLCPVASILPRPHPISPLSPRAATIDTLFDALSPLLCERHCAHYCSTA